MILAGSLGGFDPAWAQIIPSLLHANPAGRSCPSFAETRATLHSAKTLSDEELQEHLQTRISRLLIATRTTAAVAAVLSAALAYETFTHRSELQALRHRAGQAQTRTESPLFSDLASGRITPEDAIRKNGGMGRGSGRRCRKLAA